MQLIVNLVIVGWIHTRKKILETDTHIYEVVISYAEPTFATFIIEADDEETIRERISEDIVSQGFSNLKFISIKELERNQDGFPKVTKH